jgi:hypothetical protein
VAAQLVEQFCANPRLLAESRGRRRATMPQLNRVGSFWSLFRFRPLPEYRPSRRVLLRGKRGNTLEKIRLRPRPSVLLQQGRPLRRSNSYGLKTGRQRWLRLSDPSRYRVSMSCATARRKRRRTIVSGPLASLIHPTRLNATRITLKGAARGPRRYLVALRNSRPKGAKRGTALGMASKSTATRLLIEIWTSSAATPSLAIALPRIASPVCPPAP